ncbi:hypothetical protein, partial [Pseudomonas syringae group genomosp. 3]|uniref:hypothetical protein n=1 Tax=Pseudomonas syringae group genomosp. 3 TaxID=251701 RepID=UPI0023A9EB7A
MVGVVGGSLTVIARGLIPSDFVCPLLAHRAVPGRFNSATLKCGRQVLINVLKIDQSFVRDMLTDKSDAG